ncbi:hypothetical protein [Nonomuraea sp. SYSU D8015]|uniref:hypothetical protein n=1 Tax=Nonomuraea sp. SYSU D8015 TaxID=2593644 RepID=UPI001660BD1A|nr:hypothetical protein [Nonomuraea sp. SYSU D8015]
MLEQQGARAWIAPLGTPLDEPGWVEIGTIHDDGLVFEPEPKPLPDWSAPKRLTITLRGRGRFGWRFYQTFWQTPGPHARRVKREYHRRRR